MKLPVLRHLPYISPSAFITWRSCQMKTYLTKLAGHPYMPSPSGPSGVLGIMFDGLVKEYLAKKIGFKTNPLINMKRIMNDIHLSPCMFTKEQIYQDAIKYATMYIEHGLADRILKSKDIKLEQELYKIKTNKFGLSDFASVPILGRLDAITDNVPFDWKMRGFYSKWTASPHPDFSYKIDNFGENSPAITPTFRLEEININWAIQILFYNWLLGNNEYTYRIHEICWQKTGIVFSEYEGIISDEFANKIWEDVILMWTSCHDDRYMAEIQEPSPSLEKCHAYGVTCEASVHCKGYERWLELESRSI